MTPLVIWRCLLTPGSWDAGASDPADVCVSQLQHHLPVPFAGGHGVEGAVWHEKRGVLVDRGLAVLHTVMLSVCSELAIAGPSRSAEVLI